MTTAEWCAGIIDIGLWVEDDEWGMYRLFAVVWLDRDGRPLEVTPLNPGDRVPQLTASFKETCAASHGASQPPSRIRVDAGLEDNFAQALRGEGIEVVRGAPRAVMTAGENFAKRVRERQAQTTGHQVQPTPRIEIPPYGWSAARLFEMEPWLQPTPVIAEITCPAYDLIKAPLVLCGYDAQEPGALLFMRSDGVEDALRDLRASSALSATRSLPDHVYLTYRSNKKAPQHIRAAAAGIGWDKDPSITPAIAVIQDGARRPPQRSEWDMFTAVLVAYVLTCNVREDLPRSEISGDKLVAGHMLELQGGGTLSVGVRVPLLSFIADINRDKN